MNIEECKKKKVGRPKGIPMSEEFRKKCRERIFSKETREKLRLSHLGKKYKAMSDIGRKNLSDSKKGKPNGHLGLHHTEATKKKMRESALRKPPMSEITKKKLSDLSRGHVLSEESKKKIGDSHRGEKSYLWKGGITPTVKLIRRCFKYRQWRSDVFTRDDYTCQECNKRGYSLEAHHIKTFSKLIEEYKIKTTDEAINCEELWNINNGITLCVNCHKKTDTYARNSKYINK